MTGALTGSFAYGYDPAGNRTQVLENGVAAQYDVNAKNQITGTDATPEVPVHG